MARTTEIEGHPEHHVSIVRKAFAGAVLVIAAVLILKLVIGFVIAVFWGAVVVAAVIAVLWALKQIVW